MVGIMETTYKVMDANTERGKQLYHPTHCGPCSWCSDVIAQNGIVLRGATQEDAIEQARRRGM